MAIHRAGTYSATIKTPLAPSEYSKIRITFSQNQQEILIKNQGDTGVTIGEDYVEVTLTQNETLLFRPSAPSPMGAPSGAPAFLQVRCYASDLDAPASATWRIEVYDALNQEVLS